MGLLRFRENHFVTGATQRPRQTFFGCRPPALAAADHNERVGTQDGDQRLQLIATQVYLDGRFYGTLARDYAKALLVPVQQDGRTGEREGIRNEKRFRVIAG